MRSWLGTEPNGEASANRLRSRSGDRRDLSRGARRPQDNLVSQTGKPRQATFPVCMRAQFATRAHRLLCCTPAPSEQQSAGNIQLANEPRSKFEEHAVSFAADDGRE